jgi:hypothetical protein
MFDAKSCQNSPDKERGRDQHPGFELFHRWIVTVKRRVGIGGNLFNRRLARMPTPEIKLFIFGSSEPTDSGKLYGPKLLCRINRKSQIFLPSFRDNFW